MIDLDRLADEMEGHGIYVIRERHFYDVDAPYLRAQFGETGYPGSDTNVEIRQDGVVTTHRIPIRITDLFYDHLTVTRDAIRCLTT